MFREFVQPVSLDVLLKLTVIVDELGMIIYNILYWSVEKLQRNNLPFLRTSIKFLLNINVFLNEVSILLDILERGYKILDYSVVPMVLLPITI